MRDLKSRLGEPAGPRIQLPGDEEGQQLILDQFKLDESAYQIILMAAERMPRGIDVVLEHMDRGAITMADTQTLLRPAGQTPHNALPCQILQQRILGIERFGSGIFGVGAYIQIQPRPIGQICVGGTRLRHNRLEHRHGHLPRIHGMIGAGDGYAVFGFDTEDTAEIITHSRIGMHGAGAAVTQLRHYSPPFCTKLET